jgi:Na+/H+ antiporter NhaD/arsenite permease-like protein
MLALICIVFVLGYLAIALEHTIHINKAASALLAGVVCWVLYIAGLPELLPSENIPAWFAAESPAASAAELAHRYVVDAQLLHLTGELAGILFFLMGAMTIVELVDAHEGFQAITTRVSTQSKLKLLWIVAWMAFFLSSILDNLTTTIVMISLLRKLIKDRDTRLLFSGIVVIAANAGGAWTVIGDVTTTMLWIKHKISTVEVMRELFLASSVCLLLPLLVMSPSMKGTLEAPDTVGNNAKQSIQAWHRNLMLAMGIGALLSVPVFKALTHLPPFLGMLLALGVLWVVAETIGREFDEETRTSTGLLAVLKRVDMSTILFFLGILLAVGALAATGILQNLAHWLDRSVGSHESVAIIIGLVSAVVDNVPLVAAGIEMYQMPMDDPFWMLLAYCAGTGGSCLIIGSAAGVAAMGMENISFMWYLRRIAPWALLGYFGGVGVFLLQRSFN